MSGFPGKACPGHPTNRLKVHTKVHTSLENRAICAYNGICKCLRLMVLRESHHPHTVEVTGSNPVAPTSPKLLSEHHFGVPSDGRKCGLKPLRSAEVFRKTRVHRMAGPRKSVPSYR